MKFDMKKASVKHVWLVFLLIGSSVLTACTYQKGLPEPIPTPTQLNLTPLANGTPGEEDSQLPGTTPETVETEEINVPEVTATSIVDKLAGIDPTEQYVYFWYYLEPQSPMDQALNQVVDRFNQTNPDSIFIDAYNFSTANEVISKTLPLLNTSDAPALLMTTPDVVFQLADGLSDLEPFITSPKWGFSQDEIDQIIPGTLQQVQYPGLSNETLAFPVSRNAEILYYNLEWLSDLGRFAGPLSPQQLADEACTASKQSMRRLEPASLNGLQLDPGLRTFAVLTTAFGGSIFQPEQTTYILNTDTSIQAMQYLQKLSQNGCLQFVDGDAQIADNFARAETLFYIGSATNISNLQQTISQDLAFAWDVFGFPAQDGSTLPTLLPGINLSVSKASPEQMLAAWMFIQYFQTSEAQKIWIPATGEFPAIAQSGAEAAMPAGYPKLLGSLQNAPAIPVFPGMVEIDQLIHEAMVSIANGAPVEATLTDLQRNANQITNSYFDR